MSPERLSIVEQSKEYMRKAVMVDPNEPEVAISLFNLTDDDIRMTPDSIPGVSESVKNV